ncbi:uncharacterized protein MAM_06410 [Metarhizium album ARSEF 1941]|uniref:Uncharacterized protein n=1 Tax=Metarhizium album (strain ARSEF 1941) TaxID=1081103 RepID=A0A0B2WP61_METAS|nr:uncharacterized protein MAM_06410 [Metarhizium album ARSEF 1941]KHN95798.1 hypothetical protein MAM_06410 [Metarhizium album ARSEF 1941]
MKHAVVLVAACAGAAVSFAIDPNVATKNPTRQEYCKPFHGVSVVCLAAIRKCERENKRPMTDWKWTNRAYKLRCVEASANRILDEGPRE